MITIDPDEKLSDDPDWQWAVKAINESDPALVEDILKVLCKYLINHFIATAGDESANNWYMNIKPETILKIAYALDVRDPARIREAIRRLRRPKGHQGRSTRGWKYKLIVELVKIYYMAGYSKREAFNKIEELFDELSKKDGPPFDRKAKQDFQKILKSLPIRQEKIQNIYYKYHNK